MLARFAMTLTAAGGWGAASALLHTSASLTFIAGLAIGAGIFFYGDNK